MLPERATGGLFEMQDIDVGAAHAMGAGLDAVYARGWCRFGMLAELGAGGLMATHPTQAVGGFATARLGGRVLAASLSRDGEIPFAFDLLLEAGVGDQVYWVDGASVGNRPYAFAGWATLIGAQHHGVELALRFAVSPRSHDVAAQDVLCRGTCTVPTAGSTDFTMLLQAGVLSW
jgi:hypothetical protein